MERIEPRLTAVVPCRGVYRGPEGDVITETLWGLTAREYPARHSLLRVYMRWAEGVGEFALTTYIATADGEPVPDISGLAQQAQSTLVLHPVPPEDPDQPGGIGVAVHEYHDLVFPVPGCYRVMVVLDGTLVSQAPLWALTVEEAIP